MAGPSDYNRGDMDIAEQKATFDLVMNITKWGSLHIAALLLLLTVWFATEAGFVAGLIAAIVLEVLGFLALKKKPYADRAH